MFLRGQVAAVCRAIIRNLTIDARLATFDVPGLTRRHLAGTNPLGDALLLVLSSYSRTREGCILRTPAIHRSEITAIRMCHLRMILLFDCCAKMVLPRKCSLSLILT